MTRTDGARPKAGYRMVTVDGRRYMVVHFRGQPGITGRWTEPCSGCTASYEEAGAMLTRGIGCHECGYTGKRRREAWAPIPKDAA